jgi:DNA helicase-2/ATP-dependent DNA helicase PcrA
MVDEVIDNIYLINAPAGSGKTTRIRSMILNHIVEKPTDNILCITYTNRAAEELNRDITSNKVHISTIHSFLNSFLGIYFEHTEIINLYFEIYGAQIKERILNPESKEHITKSNEKYIEKFGNLDFDTVKTNITALFYNETSYNSLYYGGLSHDDLILFSKAIIDKYKVIKKRLSQKYQVIFLDEYQDASDEILDILFGSVQNTSSKLYFLGDKMQQIYSNYKGSFESEFKKLNKSVSLNINHRSISNIIDILNNLYNDSDFKQVPSEKNINLEPDHKPRIIMCQDINEKVTTELKSYPNALCLYLLNQKKFDSIGAGNLYRALNKLDRYSHIQKHSASDILVNSSDDNPDLVIKMLFIIAKMSLNFQNGNWGEILRIIKQNAKIFNSNLMILSTHTDKEKINYLVNTFLPFYINDEGTNTIKNLFEILYTNEVLQSDYYDQLSSDNEYSSVMDIKIIEFKAIINYIENPNISTQHGVKGESHDTVFFIAENSTSTPIVHMYNFYNLWSSTEISLTKLEEFYYEYYNWIIETEIHLGFNLSKITPELHKQHEHYLRTRIDSLLEYFKNNLIFNHLCKKDYDYYLESPNKTRATKCFKINVIGGILNAYRLFYVGCSRARRHLTVFIEESKISEFRDDLIKKFEQTGFTIE